MTNYSQQEQTDIIRDAFLIQSAIDEQVADIKKLNRLRFPLRHPDEPTEPRKPRKPVRGEVSREMLIGDFKVYEPQYINTTYTFAQFLKDSKYLYAACGAGAFCLLLLIGAASSDPFTAAMCMFFIVVSLPVLGIGGVFANSRYKKAVNQLKYRDPVYLQNLELAKQDASRRYNEALASANARLDQSYSIAMSTYNKDMEQYEKELDNYNKQTAQLAEAEKVYEAAYREWCNQKDAVSKKLSDELNYLQGCLASLYETTKLVSISYRETWILKWLYNDMSSSDHDVRYATELLDRDRERCAIEQVGQKVAGSIQDMHQDFNTRLEYMIDLVNESINVNIESANNISNQLANVNKSVNKFDTHQSIANVVATCQRWATTKELKKISKVFE